MTSASMIVIFILSTLIFLGRLSHSKGSLQFTASLKNQTAQLKSQRLSVVVEHPWSSGRRYTRMAESGLQSQASSQVGVYNHSPRERHQVNATVQPTVASLLENIEYSGPCSIQYCSKDTIVNCAELSLTEVISTWFPRNTTVILLDNNALEVINNSSFSGVRDLRILSLSNNNIKNIQQNAFRELGNLETLNLEHNRLSESAYPQGLFDPLDRLTDLRLRYNTERRNLPDNLFRNLKNLLSLTIDASDDTFSVGNEFPKLTRLVLSGAVKTLDEKSFENVHNLTQLIVEDLCSLSNFTDTALEPLHHLDELRVLGSNIGVAKSLHILKPLIGKNMTTIEIYHVSSSTSGSFINFYNQTGILNLEKTQYLIQICVRDIILIHDEIYVIEETAFFSEIWNKCLRSLDLSNNRIVGTKFVMLYLLNLKHIEMINIQDARRMCYDKVSFPDHTRQSLDSVISPVMKQSELCGHDLLLNNRQDNFNNGDVHETLEDVRPQLRQNINSRKGIVERVSLNGAGLIKSSENQRQCTSSNIPPRDEHFFGYYTAYFSKSLKVLKARRFIDIATVSDNIIFVGANNVVYADFADGDMREFTGNLNGLDSLQTFILSGNDVSVLADYFFDGMCNLVELDLSNCRMNTDFMANQSARIFQNLLQLKRLDISLNSLYSLKPGTFASNKMLEELDLSKNRFKNIPFNLKDTPNLKMLDLRENSLPSLEFNERDELDKQANQHGGFNLFISGNVLSCGCDSLWFLHWLATTRVRLDDGRNFTCINNEGHLSYWSVSDDLEVLWRKCSGETFLSLAVSLFFSMVIGFLSVFFIWKNKTFFQLMLLQLITGYKLKRREDYQTGVFIGYADADYTFPCTQLREFLENELELSTFVSHRDMNPSWYIANSIADAITASWRIILVFSENFLFNDEWSMFTINTAIHALSPANPARVVVLVHEKLQHRLPAEVLSAVSDDNIIVVSEWAMNYDLCEKLRTRLI